VERTKIDSHHWFACSAPIRELPDGALILGLYTGDGKAGSAFGATTQGPLQIDSVGGHTSAALSCLTVAYIVSITRKARGVASEGRE
jgi:hypothetical protein